MIDERHHIAAKALAEGGTEREAAAAAGVSKPTVSRWKRDSEFRGLILRYSDPLRKAVRESENPGELDLYTLIPEREAPLLIRLEKIVADLGRVLEKRFELMSDEEIGDIPVRLLPQFVKAYSEGLRALQDSHDRVSGYALIVDEMAKLKDESSLT